KSAFAFFFIAFALSVGGLLASTFHLGNPQRAIKAFSQWRTSWLSREGVIAVAALLVMGLYAVLLVFLDIRIAALGWLGSALSIGTVYCTAMIYGQLKTVPRWNMPTTPVLFLLYALAGGALLATQLQLALFLLMALTITQILTWVHGDISFATAGHSIGTATGLGFLGKVRLLESPHSGENYLTREMVYIVGRKHALKLRIIATFCLGLIPIVMLATANLNHISALLVVFLHIIGLFISRWLFFAEAEHVVGLYYDAR
ncbi:MAG: dimethyl sulfoxide reductase anchor subunit, partial [Proteobacteria bacterium]|nr:dimethyl sulfoxide reductase anchor subunit [Pseudomonadota bacterium]